MTNRDLAAGAIMAAVCIAVLILNHNPRTQFDGDKGNYTPSYRDKALYPKEYVHLVSAFAIMMAVTHLWVNPWVAAIVLAPAVWGYEWSQGFRNKIDMIFGWAGIVLALVLLHISHG